MQKMTYSKSAKNIILNSWKPGTRKQYNIYLSKWYRFCQESENSVVTIKTVIEFLTSLFTEGLSYSSINTAVAALKSVPRLIIRGSESHYEVSRFLKGIYNLRPPRTPCPVVWDVGKVLFHVKYKLLQEFSLKELTFKLVVLLALTTAQRVQTLCALRINNMFKLNNEEYVFTISSLLKQSKPGINTPVVKVSAYKPDVLLCPLKALEKYIEETQEIRKDNKQLFISFSKPFEPVTAQTISRWIRVVLKEAGINTEMFKAHSTRSASVSAAFQKQLPIESILKTAGWSNASVFAKYYNKLPVASTRNFADVVLNS